MNKDLVYVGVIVFLLLLIFFGGGGNSFSGKSAKVKVDSIIVYKELPGAQNSFTVHEPREKIITQYKVISNDEKYKEIIKELEKKYGEKADSVTILRELLFASKIRKYEEVFKDSVLTATVKAETKGSLEQIKFNYVLAPRKVSFYKKTVTKTVTPKFGVFLGGKVTTSTQFDKASFEVNVGVQNKQGDIIELGFDTQKRASIGFKKRLF